MNNPPRESLPVDGMQAGQEGATGALLSSCFDYAAAADYVAADNDLRLYPHRPTIHAEQELWRANRAWADYAPAAMDEVYAVVASLAELRESIGSLTKRRLFHQRLAYMIARDVVPTYGALDRGLRDLPQKLSNCRMSGKFGRAADGNGRFFWEQKCNCGKCCPDDMRAEGERLAERYIPAMIRVLAERPRAKLQKFVISPPNCPAGSLHDEKRRLMRAWAAVMRRKVARNIAGSLVVQEDPLAGGGAAWNVHLNCLLIVDGHFDWADFRAHWRREYGGECQIDMKTESDMARLTRRKLPAGQRPTRTLMLAAAMAEMVKYVAKIAGSDHAGTTDDARPMDEWPAARWFEWWQSNKGFRRTRSYGELYGVKEPEAEPEAGPVRLFLSLEWDTRAQRFAAELAPSCAWLVDHMRSFIDLIPADNSTDRPQFFFKPQVPRGPT